MSAGPASRRDNRVGARAISARLEKVEGSTLLEHDPEKWIPVFGKRSCSNKEIERDDDARKSHLALVARQAQDNTAAVARRGKACGSSSTWRPTGSSKSFRRWTRSGSDDACEK